MSGTMLTHDHCNQTCSVSVHRFDDLRNGIWPRDFIVWVVAFWMALLVIRPWEVLIPELAPLHVERTYAIFAILAVFACGRFRFEAISQSPGLLVWGFALCVSTLFAVDKAVAWDSLYVYLTLFAFYFILASIVRTPYELAFLVTCFVVIIAVFLAKSQWEYFLHDAQGFSMGVSRLRGINKAYAHPNAVAYTAVLPIPFLAFLWNVRSWFTATWPERWRRLFPWALATSLVLVLSSVVLTNSRSGLLGVILAVPLWVLSRGGIQKMLLGLLVGSVLLACTWVLMPEDSKGRFRNLWDPDSGPKAESAHASAEGRVEGLKRGLEMVRRFPLTGVGLGNFLPYRVSNLDGVPLVAHNTIGGVLGETGLLGGTAFLIFLSGVLMNCGKTKRLAAQGGSEVAWVMKELAVACRNATVLLLFLGMFGDVQCREHLYWIAAFCLLAYNFAWLYARLDQAESLAFLGPESVMRDSRGLPSVIWNEDTGIRTNE